VALNNITPLEITKNRLSGQFSIGQAGHILNFFKSHGIEKLVMVGGLKRPNFWTLRTDFVGLSIIIKLLLRRMGDDSLLKFIRNEIKSFGIDVVGIHEFMPDLLCPLGVLGNIQPSESDLKTIADGFISAKSHGAKDKGQSIIINAQGVCGVEDVNGTNALIKSCATFKGTILVKVAKPQQDLAFDMPTIGVSTIELAYKSGLKGIGVEANKTMIVNRDLVIQKCNDYGLFIMGLKE